MATETVTLHGKKHTFQLPDKKKENRYGPYGESEEDRKRRVASNAGFSSWNKYINSRIFYTRSRAAKKAAGTLNADLDEAKVKVTITTKLETMCLVKDGSYSRFKPETISAELTHDGEAIGFDVRCQRFWVKPDELLAAINGIDFDISTIKLPKDAPYLKVNVAVSVPYVRKAVYSPKNNKWMKGTIEKDGAFIILGSDGEDGYTEYKVKFRKDLLIEFCKAAMKKYEVVEKSDPIRLTLEN